MPDRKQFSTASVLDVFTEVLTARAGVVLETVHDETQLFVRSVLPQMKELQPDDQLQFGVALRATASEVLLCPYVLRPVCRNDAIMAGAIMGHSHSLWHLTDLNQKECAEAEHELRFALECFFEDDVFEILFREFQLAAQTQVDDEVLIHLSILLRLSLPNSPKLVCQILARFFSEPDRTISGLSKAITIAAHGSSDPEFRWQLENHGGAIVADNMNHSWDIKPPDNPHDRWLSLALLSWHWKTP